MQASPSAGCNVHPDYSTTLISLDQRCPVPTMSPFTGNSSILVTSPLEGAADSIRTAYLRMDDSEFSLPLLSASTFVPKAMLEHLMRNKKDLALGVKFDSGNGSDAITNMEGAMHTFVTPVVQINMHGDYAYRGQHTVMRFGNGSNGPQLARVVVLSAMVHQDFEDTKVMYRVAALENEPIQGIDLEEGFTVPSPAQKQDKKYREAYDQRLKRHLVQHLTKEGRLPAASAVKAISCDEASALLAAGHLPTGIFVHPPLNDKDVLSLELLFCSAVQQVVNEFSALEALCPQGYVYTFDPPAIFARSLGAELLNRLFIAALSLVARSNPEGFKNMRVFAFNDYSDRGAIGLVRKALSVHPHIDVVAKSALFPAPGYYLPPTNAAETLLVLHNNSDGFGQNVEFESSSGSMDGALGCHSNAAASLRRGRPRLVDQVLDQRMRLNAELAQ